MRFASPASRAVSLHAIAKGFGASAHRREIALGLLIAAGAALAAPSGA